MKPHKCPCCDGRGKREVCSNDFTTNASKVTCQACKGTGVVWEPEWKAVPTQTHGPNTQFVGVNTIDWDSGITLEQYKELGIV